MKLGAFVRRGPVQQASGERGFGEVVMVAVEDVADARPMGIALDHENRRQEEADASPDQRRMALLGVSVADPGEPCRAEDDRVRRSWARTGAANRHIPTAKPSTLAVVGDDHAPVRAEPRARAVN